MSRLPASQEPAGSAMSLSSLDSISPIPRMPTHPNDAMDEDDVAQDAEVVRQLLSPAPEIVSRGGGESSRGETHYYTDPQYLVAGSKHGTHLPTPQSPNSVSAYTEMLQYPESPLPHISRPSSSLSDIPLSRTFDRVKAATSSLMTPDSSPVYPRRSRVVGPVSPLPVSTPPRSRNFNPDEDQFATPDPGRRSESVPRAFPSRLSSPFEPRTSAKSTPRRSGHASPTMVVDQPSSGSLGLVLTSPPLTAPVPQHATANELQSLHLQMVAEQAFQLDEAEARRPDYLKRTKRPSTDNVIPDIPSHDQENTHPALGVIDSPIKGRRLALFQETSEESFEQSLLAGGYPSYGGLATWAEPKTPVQNAPMVIVEEDVKAKESKEQESRKRKRLAAFRDHNTNDTRTPLYPVKLEGLGRVLLDHIPIDFALDGPKRRGGRKRKGTFLENLVKRPAISPGKRNIELPQVKPNWPDGEFPWVARNNLRAEFNRVEEEDKMRIIEQYFDHDSDGEETDDQSLGLPPVDEELPPKRRGRGKMVPLPSKPSQPPDAKRERLLIPSDPADARAALLSKRSVRELAHRKKQEGQRTVCICNGTGDGEGEQVQCDECQKWFHLECVGIHDMSELGREEDPWYCNDCLGVDKNAHASSSPTFVPTEERMTANPKTGDAFFPVPPVQDSPPGITWNTGTPVRPPRTPPRDSDLTHTFSSSRSSMGGSSQFGPRTPTNSAHSVRVYHEPGPATFLETLDEPFDPSSTPSRGMKFSGPFTTPRAPALWGYRTASLQTPSQPHRRGGGAQHTFESNGGTSPLRTVYSNDESPVRRSTKISAPQRVPDSPLTVRQSGFPVAISLSATTQGYPPGHRL